MKPSRNPFVTVMVALVLLLPQSTTADRENSKALAFPGAEGFGARARGGRGGRILLVTTLEDYVPGKEAPVPGSLRAACEAPGPRIVVFRVAGTIRLRSGLRITQPFITIAGQTAPGQGICLKNHGLGISARDVIVRYLRVRPGDEVGRELAKRGKPFETDAISLGSGAVSVIVDHCSASWANDEVLSVSGAGITDVTVQWCIISESLDRSYHRKGAHGYGSLLRCNGNVTFHHNLYAHHSSRSPRPGTYGEGSILLDFRNNVIYNSRGYSAEDPVRMNYIGNYIRRSLGAAFTVGGAATELFVQGNFQEGAPAGNADNWKLIARAKAANRRETPYAVVPVRTDSARRAYEKVLASCGAVLPARDAVDRRVVEEVRNGRGRLIDSQRDVGGWPDLKPAPPPQDSDQDGIPDAWERANGLRPRDSSDAAKDGDGDGYTNVEEWINGTDPLSPGFSPGFEARRRRSR